MSASAVILAAGLGTRLRPHTDTMPKCLTPMGDRAIIEQAVDSLERAGVRLIVPVVGYRAEMVSTRLGDFHASARLVYSANDAYAATGTAASLLCGLRTLERERPAEDVVVAEGDIWFDEQALTRLLGAQEENAVAVDARGVGGEGSLVQLGDDRAVASWHFLSHGGRPPAGEAWRLANIYRFSARTWSKVLVPGLAELVGADPRIPLEVALQRLCVQGRLRVHAVPLDGCRWWEVDNESDLAAATARCIHGLPPRTARLAADPQHSRAGQPTAPGRPGADSGSPADAESAPLLPVQARFFRSTPTDVDNFSLGAAVLAEHPISRQEFHRAVDACVARHDSLRSAFHGEADLRWATLAGPAPGAADHIVTWHEADAGADEARLDELMDAAVQEHRAALRSDRWPLWRIDAFARDDRLSAFAITLHHLVSDAASTWLLLHDLARICAGQDPFTGGTPTGIGPWARELARFADDDRGLRELPYWTSLPWGKVGAPPDAYSTEAEEWQWARAPLTPEATEHVLRTAKNASLDPRYLLQATAARARHQVSGTDTTLFDVVTSGRPSDFPGVDLGQTVGWLVGVHPAVIHTGGRPTSAAAVAAELARVPHEGVGWGALRYLAQSDRVHRAVADLPQAHLYFNYTGALRKLDRYRLPGFRLSRVRESFTPRSEPYTAKFYPHLVEGRLVLQLQFRPDMLSADEAGAWVDAWRSDLLRALPGASGTAGPA